MNISIIGTGYVGLVTGTCLAKLGNNIICVNIDKKKIEKINKGITPIYEEGLDKLLKNNKKKIKATTDYKTAIKETAITFICVGTPSKKDGSIDLSYIKKATIEIGGCLKEKKEWHLVVIKSTVLPETTEKQIIPILEKYSKKKAGKNFGVATNPEFLREGIAVKDFLEPDRIIIGSYDKKSEKTPKNLHNSFK